MQDSKLFETWCYANTLFKSPQSSGITTLANVEITWGFQTPNLRHLQDSEGGAAFYQGLQKILV